MKWTALPVAQNMELGLKKTACWWTGEVYQWLQHTGDDNYFNFFIQFLSIQTPGILLNTELICTDHTIVSKKKMTQK